MVRRVRKVARVLPRVVTPWVSVLPREVPVSVVFRWLLVETTLTMVLVRARSSPLPRKVWWAHLLGVVGDVFVVT